ncbi:unnamed protein product [Dracunculus medinensis]|uniref:Lipase n=1 Tax=Dracunculus medinensis TaxID=318479 RepID=A0A0N4U4F4_DRAME|nr:unnamed protein product [Dracunculus medinensis]
MRGNCNSLRPNYLGDVEAHMTVPEIINRWGYPVETHTVTTEDGYILVMHRIPHGQKESRNSSVSKPIIFLQHGLLCTSSVWIMNQPHQSAAFIFADLGFDVWMGNNRGNTYSRKHLKYSARNRQYWHFTWSEMAKYDMLAMINGVLKWTNRSHLYYVGHSQGTLTMFTKLSEDEHLNKKVKIFFALAPVGTIAHVKGLFSVLGNSMYRQFQIFSLLFGDTEFLPNNFITRLITKFICGIASKKPLCENFIFMLSGPDSHQLNKSRIGVYLSHNPAGTSTRNMWHIAQMVRHGKHSAFDYIFPALNKKFYGTSEPPTYNISTITTEMHLYYSDEDWISTGTDVRNYLLTNLPSAYLKSVNKLKDFNHNDFLWGWRAPKEIYLPIAKQIWSDYSKNNGTAEENCNKIVQLTDNH